MKIGKQKRKYLISEYFLPITFDRQLQCKTKVTVSLSLWVWTANSGTIFTKHVCGAFESHSILNASPVVLTGWFLKFLTIYFHKIFHGATTCDMVQGAPYPVLGNIGKGPMHHFPNFLGPFYWLCFCTDFRPTVSNNPTTKKKNRTSLIVGIVVGGVVSFLAVFAVLCLVKRKRQQTNEDEGKPENLLTIYYSCLTSRFCADLMIRKLSFKSKSISFRMGMAFSLHIVFRVQPKMRCHLILQTTSGSETCVICVWITIICTANLSYSLAMHFVVFSKKKPR